MENHELSVNGPGIFCELTGDFLWTDREFSANCQDISINIQDISKLPKCPNKPFNAFHKTMPGYGPYKYMRKMGPALSHHGAWWEWPPGTYVCARIPPPFKRYQKVRHCWQKQKTPPVSSPIPAAFLSPIFLQTPAQTFSLKLCHVTVYSFLLHQIPRCTLLRHITIL